MEFLRTHQLTIMLFISGTCGVLAILALVIRSLPPRRKRILSVFEASVMMLLLSDRYAYLFRGDTSRLGWWMVRVSNFLMFFFWLFILYVFTEYLIDLYANEGGLAKGIRRLKACKVIFAAGVALLVISQFTGLYYTFDDTNQYQRSTWMPLSYAAPFLIMLLHQSVVIQYRKRLSRSIFISLMLNTYIPFVASIIQLFAYGVSLANIAMNGAAIALFILALYDIDDVVERARNHALEVMEKEKDNQRILFEQTAEALVNAIDAKDQYTHGHSARVARYSEMIAKEAGKSEEELREIYYAALLHDVGKIGVPREIINKVGKLTDEEFAQMKLHPVYGNNILSRIQKQPNISIGAKYHHERYDGKGYPEGLKGEDIPEIARIIGVADSYDAMTSKRSYRTSIPQHLVREELLKGTGTQFDPRFARIMIRLLDHDVHYDMQDHYDGNDTTIDNPVQISTKYSDILDGVFIIDKITRIHLTCRPEEGVPEGENLPTLIIFDALDGRIHEDKPSQEKLFYFEYGRIRLDGKTQPGNARKIETTTRNCEPGREEQEPDTASPDLNYDIELVRYRDHAMIRISNGSRIIESVIALTDSTHFTYAAFRGEHCVIENITAEQDEESVPPDYIPRIAEEISFISGCPEGDIPNIQIDSWRTASTEGIPITDNMTITFHSKSLPMARLVWHCPFICIFSSKDGRVNGEDFQEYMLLRLDGETWESDRHAENTIHVDHTMAFEGWNAWKEKNKEGLDFTVPIRREGNTVSIRTENLGIIIAAETKVLDNPDGLYVALTGDQCALTNIRITSGEADTGRQPPGVREDAPGRG